MLRCVLTGAVAATFLAGSAWAQMGPPSPGPRCLPGSYDGVQMEIAAGLELGADHRFRYGLSYGALDEEAAGTWEADGAGNVLLTSDPITPPGFAMTGEALGPSGQLTVQLEVPIGISRQHFGVIARFADGRTTARQFAEDGLVIELGMEDRLVSLTLLLPVLDLESEAFKIAANGGGEVRFRFLPNDIGRVDFSRAPLRIDREDLLLERHGRTLRFRPLEGGCARQSQP